MNSNGDFLPLTRTPKVGNTTLGVFLCCSLVAQAREMGRFDRLGRQMTVSWALLQKDRELI